MPLPNVWSAALFASVLMFATVTAGAEPLLQAPYQIDEIQIDPRVNLSYGEAYGQQRSLPLIDLDQLGSPTQADVDRWVEATVLTEYGAASATLIGLRKRCEFLCGIEAEETCYYQAALEPQEGYDLGGVWAALPGPIEIADYEFLEPKPIYSLPRWSPEFHAPLWSDEARRIRVDGWTPHARRLQLTVETSGTEQTIDKRGCRASAVAGLTVLACHGIALIAADGVPLLLSDPDNDAASATPIAKFTHNGELYILVRLGLEFQAIYGLLVRRDDGWDALFRKIERPLAC